eukprot:CCRYP_009488-RA/>CCRYP_009488-RA protein AED:0.11 eAED:0.11 QI:0/-1/0/1/-1/1/1/0/2248
MDPAQIMPRPIPDDHDETSSGKAYIMQQKEQSHFSVWNHVSPDLNAVGSKNDCSSFINRPAKIYHDNFARVKAKKDTNKVNSTPHVTSILVSPEAQSAPKSPGPTVQSEMSCSNENSLPMVVTPLNITTPTRAHVFPSSPMTGPLKSPFVASMTILDSKLASLKKSQYKLDDRIEQMSTWLDESGMEDSFDGELVFGELDFGRCDGMDGKNGNINWIRGKCGDGNDQERSTLQENDGAEGTDDVSIRHMQSAAKTNEKSFNRCGSPKVERCSEPISPSNEKVMDRLPPLIQRSHDGRMTPSNNWASHSDSVQSLLRLYETPEHHQPSEDSVHSCQVESFNEQNAPNHEESSTTALTGSNNQTGHVQNSPSDSSFDTEHISESDATKEHQSISNNVTGSSCVPTNETYFFPSSEGRENQIFSTPSNCSENFSRRSEISNIYDAALDGVGRGEVVLSTCECESICDTDCSRSDSYENGNGFHKEDTPSSIWHPSPCYSNIPAKRAMWSGDSPLQMEASSDLNHIMSKMSLDPMSLQNTTLSNMSRQSCSIHSYDGKTSLQNRCSSPIKPKKLYNTNEDTDSRSHDDENDLTYVASVAPITAQHSLIGENHFAANIQWQLKDESADRHNITVEGESCLSSVFMRHVFAGLSREEFKQRLATGAEKQFHAKQATAPANADLIDQVASSPSAPTHLDLASLGNNELVQQLLALVAKLRFKLTEANDAYRCVMEERDALSLERDDLLQQNQEYLTSKLDSQALIDNLHSALASKETEINQLRVEKEIKEFELKNFRHQDKDTRHVSISMKQDHAKIAPKTSPASHKTKISNITESVSKADGMESAESENDQLTGRLEETGSPCLCADSSTHAMLIANHGAKRSDTDILSEENRSIYLFPYTRAIQETTGSQSIQLNNLETKFAEIVRPKDKLDDSQRQFTWKHHDLECQLNDVSTEKDTDVAQLEQTSLLSFIETSNDSITPTLVDLQNSNSSVEQELLMINVQANQMTERLPKALPEKGRLESKLKAANHTIQSSSNKIQSPENHHQNLVKKLELAEHHLSGKQNEIDLLSSERNKHKKTIEVSRMTSIEDDKATMEESLLGMTVGVDDLRRQIDQKETTISSLQEAIISLKSEMSSCSERLGNTENKLCDAISTNEHALDVAREMNQCQVETNHCLCVALTERDRAIADAQHQSSLLLAAENENQSRLGSMQSTILHLNKQVDALSEELASKDAQIITLLEEKSCTEARLLTFQEIQNRLVAECKSVRSRFHEPPLDKEIKESFFPCSQSEDESSVLHSGRIQDVEKDADEIRALFSSMRDKNASLVAENNRVRTRAAVLSVIALQLKMRSAKANNKERCLREKIDNAELSLAELNDDRRRLVEYSIALKEEIASLANEKEALLLKSHDFNVNTSSSTALVLDGECSVEAVNCTTGTSAQHDIQSEVCKKKLQFTIASLASALIKLKMREMTVFKQKITLEERLVVLQKQFQKVGEHLSKLVSQRKSLNHVIVELKTEITEELQTLNKYATQSVHLLSKANRMKKELVELHSEKEDLEAENENLKEVLHKSEEDDNKLDSKTHISAAMINQLQIQDVADRKLAQTVGTNRIGQADHSRIAENLEFNCNILSSDEDDGPLEEESELSINIRHEPKNDNATAFHQSENSLSSQSFNSTGNPNDIFAQRIASSTMNPSKEAATLIIQNNHVLHRVVRCFSDIVDRNKSEAETSPLDITTNATNQELIWLKQQQKTRKSLLASNEEDCAHTMSERKKSHQLRTHGYSELMSNLKLENNALCDQKQCLEHEKETISSLRCELQTVIAEKDEMERSMKASQQNMMHEMNCLLGTIASLKSEKESLTAQLRECQAATMHFSQRVKSSESECELAKKLRRQLESQLNDRTVEADALKQTVTSQAARIEELHLKVRLLSQEKDADRTVLSAMHCDMKSLAAERDIVSSQLTNATNDLNALRAEHENLKHELRSSLSGSAALDGTDCSVKTFGSCEYVGTVCEESLPVSPGRDIISILSSPQISEEDIHHVLKKMRQLHSILSQVQDERTSLKQEVQYLKTVKESHENQKQRYPLDTTEVDMLLRRTSKSFNTLIVENQNEILRLNRELEDRDQPRLPNYTTPNSALSTPGLKFEVSLKTPRVSNLVAKNNVRSSPRPRPKSKSPRFSNKVRSKERFEIRKGQSIFSMFRDTKKSGRKDKIKYREANKDTRSVDSEPLSPGEKRKREQAEQMMKSLRRRCEN